MHGRIQKDGQSTELNRPRSELKRVTKKRDILKMAAAYFVKEGVYSALHYHA